LYLYSYSNFDYIFYGGCSYCYICKRARYERVESIRDDVEIIHIPGRDIAVGLGTQIVANMVMLGQLAKHSETVSLDLLKDAVKTRMREIKIKALEEGFSR
jgi:Pyruvate/2-oxoacid:ferredoxin oxidoreductase gamma subunit